MTLGGHTLLHPLGRGSMGEVWLATGEAGEVAVKIPRRPAFVRHLRREGVLLAAVDHPNVASFVDADVEGELPWLATERVTGEPLRAVCTGSLPTQDVVLLADQILAGLAAIHRAGALHLDLKPENVIVTSEGTVKIVDLGLGMATTRFMEEVYLSVSLASRELPVAGTLAYMAPEQRRGKALDARTDLFAFGILLHELLTGVLPEPGMPPSALRPELAPRWDVLVARLTHPHPERRPADADQARHLVAFTLADKARPPIAEGGLEPRDLKSFDEDAFALASPYLPGMVIGDGYELVRPLGRGGFAEVWDAQRAGMTCAVKLILRGDAAAALAQEAEAMARIDHPGIPNLIADRSSDDPPHLVIELIGGESLRLVIHRDELIPVPSGLAVFAGMVDVVRACSEAGVVHRDLKPEHFLVDWEQERPRVSLIDFGLAALMPDADAVDGTLVSRVDAAGTLDYMAPEQRRGEVSPACDVYALGVCLFELLTHSLPRGPQGLRLVRREVPRAIDALCQRMLSHDPSRRPSLAEAAEQVVVRPGRKTGRIMRWGRSDDIPVGPGTRLAHILTPVIVVAGLGGALGGYVLRHGWKGLEVAVRDRLGLWGEEQGIGPLRTLGAAQDLYREADKDRNDRRDYAPDLAALAEVELIDAALGSGVRRGYRFDLCRSDKEPEFLWMAIASPVDAGPEDRHFAINHEGVVYVRVGKPFRLDRAACQIRGGQPLAR